MAIVSALSNANIEYGNPTDIRMNNGNTGVVRPPLVILSEDEKLDALEAKREAAAKAAAVRKASCPKGTYYQGMADGVAKCKSLDSSIKYRDKDKQAAYEKAIASGIEWTGKYVKDELSGEVIPKTLEDLTNEAKGIVAEPNLLKKYWWVLAAIGVYLIISND